MSDSYEVWQQNIALVMSKRLATIEDALLAEKFITERRALPKILVSGWGAKAHIGLIDIFQSIDGNTVTQAEVWISAVYLGDLLAQKRFLKLLDILTAHLACAIYFPFDPCPGTTYWNRIMYRLGNLAGPSQIPGFKPIKCVRKKRPSEHR